MTRASAWLAAALVEAEASSVTWYRVGTSYGASWRGVLAAGCRLQVGSGVGRHDGGVVVAPSSRVAEVRRGGWSRVWSWD